MTTPLIDRHCMWLKAAGRADQTITKRRRLLLHLDARLEWGIDHAEEDELVEYFAAYAVPWTRYTYDTHARGFYRWAVPRRHLTIDPMAGIPKPRPGQFFANPCSDEDLAVALAAPPPYDRAMLLASRAGLRCGEICRARRRHLGRDGRLRVAGKGGKTRFVPLDHVVLAETTGVDWLLGGEVTSDWLTDHQRDVWRHLGLPDTFHLHQGRHWYATALSDAGVPVEVIQELLGHASLDMTRGYLRVRSSRLLDAAHRLRRVEPEPDGSRLGRP